MVLVLLLRQFFQYSLVFARPKVYFYTYYKHLQEEGNKNEQGKLSVHTRRSLPVPKRVQAVTSPMDFVVVYVLGGIAALFGLVICRNRRLRALMVDFFVQEEALNSYSQYTRVGLQQHQ